MEAVAGILIVLAFFALIAVGSSVRILREYERGVIFRLGRLIAQKGPGLILLIPVVDRMVKLDQLLADRERLNEELQKIIDESTEPWGIKVTAVEIKDVEIPEQMQRAMARQAEAERERRAKIINSEGEFQAAQKLTDAADIISTNPASLQLRYLQTLLEIGSNQNTTVVFPLPMDVLEPFIGKGSAERAKGTERAPRQPAPSEPQAPPESPAE